MLTADDLAQWQETFRVWQQVRDVSELAEIMAALEPDEREQVWAMLPDCRAVRAEVERLLHGSPE